MKFSYSWLKELVPEIPSAKETAELLTMHAFEVEDVIGESPAPKKATADQGGDDTVFNIDILPNRMADASSHIGVARDLAAIMTVQGGKKVELALPDMKVEEDAEMQANDLIAVKIEDRLGCPFYAARVMRGVTVKQSPSWLRKRLKALGVDSINNIVDVVNCVMLETGQPLHAFDLRKIASVPNAKGKDQKSKIRRIVVRKAKQGEKMKALDGETYSLGPFVTVIADEKRVIAIGGVKGGATSGISEKTTDIVLEAALFYAKRIYRTSRLTGIVTDASKRFEAGRTAGGTLQALDRVAKLIQELAGGSIASGVVTAGKATARGRAIPFSVGNAELVLGVSVSAKEAKRALEAIGCTVRVRKGSDRVGPQWVVNPPKERMDITIEEDLIEEVGRLIGYTVEAVDMPRASLIPAIVNKRERWSDKVRDVLAAAGLREVMRYSFVSEDLMKSWGHGAEPMRRLENPQSSERTHLRPTLLPGLLAMAERERKSSVARSASGGKQSVRIFEIGSIFEPKPQGKLLELRALGIVIAEQALTAPSGFVGEHSAYFLAKGVAEELLEGLGITDIVFKPLGDYLNIWAEGRSAEIFAGKQWLGVVGELAPVVLKKHKTLGSVAMVEFDMGKVVEAASAEHEYRAPSKFPEVLRDMAVLVPLDVTADDVNQAIVQAGPNWLRDVDLFDYYEGDQISDGMKSLAFRLAYQSHEETLTDRAVNKAQTVIEEALREMNFEIR